MVPTAPNRLRVVHLVLQLDTGGMEKLLVEFARHADRQRFDLRFVSLTTRGTLGGDIEALGWPVTALHDPGGLRPGLLWRLSRLFREWKTDVVHAHNSRPLIYGAPAARLAGVSTVVATRHGQSFGVSRRKHAAYRLSALFADHVVTVSQDVAELSASRGLRRSKLRVICNGIDTARFAFAGPQAGGPAVYVGRLAPEKDVGTLLHAAAEVVRAEPAFRLEIAGDGVCAADLHRLADELGLHGHVRFLGEVRDVPALLQRASVFVLPSLTEGISLTVLEAMARGLPVVTTRVGGNREVVAEGETGLLVSPADPHTLAGALLQVHRHPDEGRRMGQAGRLRVESQFDVRQTVAAYEALYEGQSIGRPLATDPAPRVQQPRGAAAVPELVRSVP
jgi:glycosyltransferase involved in cell wall biosynthesis